jgi:WD40 repeat protein
MRLIPRTARGTVLLTAVAWLMAAVALWHALPPRPRLSLTLTGRRFAGFRPGSGELVTTGYRALGGGVVPTGPVELRDPDTGAVRAEYLDGLTMIGHLDWSADGRRLSAVERPPVNREPGRAYEYRVHVLDADSGREVAGFAVPVPQGRTFTFGQCLSPDGRTLAFTSTEDGAPAVKWWDLEAGRERATFAGEGTPFGFSPDGRWFVATTPPENGRRLAVRDAGTGRERWGRFVPDRAAIPWEFSPDGTLLAVDGIPGAIGLGLTVWNLATGESRAELPWADSPAFTSDGGGLIVRHYNGADIALSRRDWTAADYRYHTTASDHPERRIGEPVLSADGSVVALRVHSDEPTAFQK